MGFQHRVRQDDPEEQPGAQLAADQIRVLALPAEACALRQWFFHQRRSIDEYFDFGAAGCCELPRQLFEALLDQFVIIGIAGIGGDDALLLACERLQRIFIRTIVQTENDGRSGVRPHFSRVPPAFEGVRHPRHFAVAAGCYEFRESFGGVPLAIDGGDARHIEPAFAGLGPKDVCRLVQSGSDVSGATVVRVWVKS